MGYARHIGRVGALAVTLGVGVAIASGPGVAFAGPSGSSTSTGDSSTTTSSTGTGTVGTDTPSAGGADGASDTGANPSQSADDSAADADAAAGEEVLEGVDGTDATDDEVIDGENAEGSSDEGDGDGLPAEGDNDAASADDGQDGADEGSGGSDGADQQDPGADDPGLSGDAEDDTTGADDTQGFARFGRQQSESLSFASVNDTSGSDDAAADSRATTTLREAADVSTEPAAQTSLVGVISDLVAAVLQPFFGTGDGVPIPLSIVTAMLGAVRDELARVGQSRNSNRVSQQYTALVLDSSGQPTTIVDPLNQHVLVIGVDGTNLQRILNDPENPNTNFLNLIGTSTVGAPSIAGHTTISNPSWTAILTGVWGERTGVINNVWTPKTYNRFPTVFNQLESENPLINTVAIADWDVITAIASSGSHRADTITFVPQVEGDTNWLDTDDEVGEATVDAINSLPTDAPSFLFSYFVGVDENGHMYGGASPEYAAAINNVDENLGLIMGAVTQRESETDEDWTIIVVTDHGHQPQKGFGHGFQSPDETSTFVIADGPDFEDGWVNPKYSIVDTTPTVMRLMGFDPRPGSDGVPLQDLSGSDEHPDDQIAALEAQIASNKTPGLITNLRLSVRTIFAFIPQYIYDARNGSDSVPLRLILDGAYVVTNIPAQIVAFATGVYGASIFPIIPPQPPTDYPPAEDLTAPDTVLVLACSSPSATGSLCGEGSVA